MPGEEDLRGVGIEDGIHDVREEVEGAVPGEERVGGGGGGGGKETGTGEGGGDAERATAAERSGLDGESAEDGPWDADGGDDERVMIGELR